MAGARFDPDYGGIGDLLQGPEMLAVMLRVAQKVKDAAEAIAPVGDPRRDPHAGRYKASFGIDLTRHGGLHRDRAEATVYNDSPEALVVEFGNSRQAGHHTLLIASRSAR